MADGDELTVELLPDAVRGRAEPPRPIRIARRSISTRLTSELVRQGMPAAGPQEDDLHDEIVNRVERELIEQVMQSCDNVQIKAAARLGINRNTLHKKLREYSLESG